MVVTHAIFKYMMLTLNTISSGFHTHSCFCCVEEIAGVENREKMNIYSIQGIIESPKTVPIEFSDNPLAT